MKTWTRIQAQALTKVFEILNSNNIPWMIMRNYEGLPNNNNSKDVDMAIPKKYWCQAQQLIYKEIKKLGFEYVQFTRFQSIWCHTFYRIDELQTYTFKLDIFGGYEWRGSEYLDFEKLYSRSILYNNIHVPNEVDNAAMLLLKPLILGGVVYDKYKVIITKVINSKRKEFLNVLGDIIGNKEAEILVKILEEDEKENFNEQQKVIRYKIWIKSIKKYPIKTITNLMEHYFLEIKRRVLTTDNRIFAILGPDGVGKTTFLQLLTEGIGDMIVLDRANVKTIHFRPNIIPNLKKLLNRNYDVSKEKFHIPHRANPVNPISSFIRLTYYWLDYLIGLPIISVKARYKNLFIVFDRYFQDFLVDPYRARIKLPYQLRKTFFTLVYKPKITFILQADADTIYNRKQELNIAEINRQLEVYTSLVDGEKTVVINAEQEPEKMTKDAIDFIIKRLYQKI